MLNDFRFTAHIISSFSIDYLKVEYIKIAQFYKTKKFTSIEGGNYRFYISYFLCHESKDRQLRKYKEYIFYLFKYVTFPTILRCSEINYF